ncbi:hypothetical protein ACWDMY_32700, partial [Streptomyces globisporus]
LDLVKVAETYGLPGVRRLVESWGLVWGKDVLDPPQALGPADLNAEQLALQEPREIPPAEAKFLAARKAANEARAKDVAAALDRFRNPRRDVPIKVSLKKPIRAKQRPAA